MDEFWPLPHGRAVTLSCGGAVEADAACHMRRIGTAASYIARLFACWAAAQGTEVHVENRRPRTKAIIACAEKRSALAAGGFSLPCAGLPRHSAARGQALSAKDTAVGARACRVGLRGLW